jgi:hypothetical protein
MAVVDFGAVKIDGERTQTVANPKANFALSTFGEAAAAATQGQTIFVTGSIQYFKRGFRLATGQFEYWRTGVRDNGPPSGNTLIDITVINEIRDP